MSLPWKPWHRGFKQRVSTLKRSLLDRKRQDEKKKSWRGPKTKLWERVRRQLKIEFFKRGITTREVKFPGCWVDNGLGFMHRFKRRFIAFADEDELRRVCLACNHCHDIAELSGPEKMKALVDSIIQKRNEQ